MDELPEDLRKLVFEFLEMCTCCRKTKVLCDGVYINGRFVCDGCIAHAGIFLLSKRFCTYFIKDDSFK